VQLQTHAADTDRATNLYFGTIAALLPIERAGATVLRSRYAETSMRLPAIELREIDIGRNACLFRRSRAAGAEREHADET
jgi:hypothetical protein